MNIKIAIVEDNASVREGLAGYISLSSGFQLVANCRNATIALKELPAAAPDVTLMDINLPDLSGIECIRKLKPVMPRAQFLMLTIEENSRRVFEALEAGAHGYLIKNLQPDRILEAVKEVYGGGSPISPQIARMLVQRFQQPAKVKTAAPPSGEKHNLSEREEQILQLVAQGNRAKDIADMLSISIHTVQTHVRNIYDKLHVRSSAEAVARYFT